MARAAPHHKPPDSKTSTPPRTPLEARHKSAPPCRLRETPLAVPLHSTWELPGAHFVSVIAVSNPTEAFLHSRLTYSASVLTRVPATSSFCTTFIYFFYTLKPKTLAVSQRKSCQWGISFAPFRTPRCFLSMPPPPQSPSLALSFCFISPISIHSLTHFHPLTLSVY